MADRIAAKVLVTAAGCWLWTGCIDGWGYGRIKVAGRCALAHRESYLASGRPIADGLVLRHQCPNTSCVNPDHLIPGTDQENSDDVVANGPTARRKLTPTNRAELVRMRRDGATFAGIGSALGVAKCTAHASFHRHAGSTT